MAKNERQADDKNAHQHSANDKSPGRAPEGPLLGSGVNHSRSPA
jgi:hypothetical protein